MKQNSLKNISLYLTIFSFILIIMGYILTFFVSSAFTYVSHIVYLIFPVVVFIHAVKNYGGKITFVFIVVSIIVGLLFEITGVLYGFPFGKYHYTDVIKPKILSLVPWSIILYWFLITYVSFNTVDFILSDDVARSSFRIIPLLSIIDGLCAVTWDLIMDPVMVHLIKAWLWEEAGVIYGIPISNFVGWIFVTFIITILYRVSIYKSEISHYNDFVPTLIYIQLWLTMAIVSLIHNKAEYIYISLFPFLIFTLLSLIRFVRSNSK